MLILHPIFIENGNTLAIRLGIPIATQFNPTADDTYLVFGGHDHAMMLLEQQEISGCKYIILNSESPASNHLRNKYFIKLMQDNSVWDYHPLSTAYLRELDIKVHSQYIFEYPELVNDTPREIDILFVGSRSDKREAIMNDLKVSYPALRIEALFDLCCANPSDYTKLLHQAKCVVNIPFYDHSILEMHRINKALACGCRVVSLKSGHKDTDNIYGEYIDFTLDLHEYFSKNHTDAKSTYGDLIKSQSIHTRHNKWLLEQIALET